jgi:GTPase SAR1 family protein
MSFALDYFNQNRKLVLTKLNTLGKILDELNCNSDSQKVRRLIEQMDQEQFRIAVVGEFSRGKSTFINALLGKRILPSSAIPTTTILNTISYHPVPSIQIHYRDETKPSRMITEEDFAKLVAPMVPEQGNEQSEREYSEQYRYLQSIKFAEIGYPISFCKDGVQIIDTPGTNDLDPAREEITNNIIPKSDAAILLLSATKILSESEVSFLRDRLLANDIQKIFVVINYKDNLKTQEDVQKVLAYAGEHLQDILKEPKIFMVTAKEALNARRAADGEQLIGRRGPLKIWDLKDTGFTELEQVLADFLQFERGAVKLKKPIQQAVKMVDQVLEKQITFGKRALTTQIQDLQLKVQEFYPKIQRMKLSGKETLRKVELELKKEENVLAAWYDEQLQQITQNGMATFERHRALSKQEISSNVENAIAPMERALHETKKQKITNTIKNLVMTLSKNVNEEWAQMDRDLQRLWTDEESNPTLAISVSNSLDAGAPSLFSEIYQDLDEAWANEEGFLGKLAIGAGYAVTFIVNVAVSIFSMLFGEDEKTKMRRQLEEQFNGKRREKVTAFRQEWKGWIKAVQRKYDEAIAQHLSQLENQLTTLLQNTRLEQTDVQKNLEILERQEARLKMIKEELQLLFVNMNQKSEKVGAQG